MSLSGTPTSTDVGTYTIIVSVTDTKNESASTSFLIDVQKNYFPVVQKQIDDLQLELNVTMNLPLDSKTFVDPNGDTLSYSTNELPSWLAFDPSTLTFSGKPTTYGNYNISLTARDSWNGYTTMNFVIVAGIRPNTPPYIVTKLTDKEAYRKELFVYKFPATAFNDSDGD